MTNNKSFFVYTFRREKPLIKRRLKISAAVFFPLLLLGCDPVRRIDMVNNTADTVQFTWKLNEDSLMHNPFLLSNAKDLVFTLIPSKSPVIKLPFGEGNWSPREVQKLVGFLNGLEIKSASQKIKFDSLPLLKEFLLARRKGVGGARIEIAINEAGRATSKQ